MSGDYAQYKNYRNTIRKLTQISKKQYYSQFFSNNLKNVQKAWEGINTVLNRKKRTSMKINCLKQSQPRSQGLSSSRPLERERERETLVWSGHLRPKIWDVAKKRIVGGAVKFTF